MVARSHGGPRKSRRSTTICLFTVDIQSLMLEVAGTYFFFVMLRISGAMYGSYYQIEN